jgi:hypothetical protein
VSRSSDVLVDVLSVAEWFDIEAVDDVDGWLSGPEGQTLFALGALVDGPVLEVGPWLGRSTVCIARGIAMSDRHKPFTTVELNPGPEDWVLRDGIRYFRPNGDGEVGGTPEEDWEANIAPVVRRPGGVIGQLRDNLTRCGVDRLVVVQEGDFRHLGVEHPSGPFGLIFIDAMHTPEEVDRNAPRLAELLGPGSVLACHDTTPENRSELGLHFQFSDELQVDSLFVGVVA